MAIIPNSTTDHGANANSGALVYESNRTQLLMLGGKNNSQGFSSTWTLADGATNWSLLTPTTSPGIRFDHAMAYNNGTTMVFGGTDGLNILDDVWTWNGTTWTLVSQYIAQSLGPTKRFGHAMATNNSNNTIMFGGFGTTTLGNQILGETWQWSGGLWTQLSPSVQPPFRMQHSMAAAGANIYMFGGEGGVGATSLLNDLYVFNGTNWSAVNTAGTVIGTSIPGARARAVMTYDSSRNQLVLFGGRDGTHVFNDTWIFNIGSSTWSLASTTVHPTRRYDSVMAYSTGTSSSVLFGGKSENKENLGDVWSYGTSWSGAGDFNAAQSTGPVF
jgi:hypothetical protein